MKLPILLATVLALGALAPATSGEEKKAAEPKECCLLHDGLTEPCRVARAEEETCKGILGYLNTPGTGGKTYCGGTTLRGGWKLVDCPGGEKEKP